MEFLTTRNEKLRYIFVSGHILKILSIRANQSKKMMVVEYINLHITSTAEKNLHGDLAHLLTQATNVCQLQCRDTHAARSLSSTNTAILQTAKTIVQGNTKLRKVL